MEQKLEQLKALLLDILSEVNSDNNLELEVAGNTVYTNNLSWYGLKVTHKDWYDSGCYSHDTVIVEVK